jgi:ketosteroid isomerase-like protein
MKATHLRLLPLFVAAISLQIESHAGEPSRESVDAEILRFEEGFSSALAANDMSALQAYLADDWSIVSGDGQLISRARFLSVVASGDLKHDKMNFQQPTIRIYGNTALATSHAQSGGSYKGVAFHTDEIGTDVIVKIHGRWLCVLTQLTTVAQR